MERQLTITADPINEPEWLAQRSASPAMGAVVYFIGLVRGNEGDEAIQALNYEAFEEMAMHQFGKILQAMEERWPIGSVRLVHRVGVVGVNEPSLCVEVVARHRGEAFAACQFLIEQMKRLVPIWKRPISLDRENGGS